MQFIPLCQGVIEMNGKEWDAKVLAFVEKFHKNVLLMMLLDRGLDPTEVESEIKLLPANSRLFFPELQELIAVVKILKLRPDLKLLVRERVWALSPEGQTFMAEIYYAEIIKGRGSYKGTRGCHTMCDKRIGMYGYGGQFRGTLFGQEYTVTFWLNRETKQLHVHIHLAVWLLVQEQSQKLTKLPSIFTFEEKVRSHQGRKFVLRAVLDVAEELPQLLGSLEDRWDQDNQPWLNIRQWDEFVLRIQAILMRYQIPLENLVAPCAVPRDQK